MQIKYYPTKEIVTQCIQNDDPLLMVMSFDGNEAIVAPVDEAVEHHVLLNKCEISPLKIDKYFRIIFDSEGADWTFICPSDYKNISDKYRRIKAFYNDGFGVISATLTELDYFVGINIPKRYRRHLDELKN